MDSKKVNEQFELVYKSKIERSIAPLEDERQQLLKYKKIIISIVILTLVITIVTLQCFPNSKFELYVFILFFIVLSGGMFFLFSKENCYRKKIKNNLLMSIFSIFGKFYYSEKELISLNKIRESGLFRDARRKKDNDRIVGVYKGLNISITETKLTHEVKNNLSTNSNNSSETVTDFSGLILRIKMNKNFEGHTVVRQKPLSYEQFVNNLKNFQANNKDIIPPETIKVIEAPTVKFLFKSMQFIKEHDISFNDGLSFSLDKKSSKGKPWKLDNVILEDTEFNEIFNVFSNNQIEARYLLTPSFMERLKNISAVMLVTDVNCIFKDGEIILFLGGGIVSSDNKNNGFFELEPKSGETLFSKAIYKRVFLQLLTIFDLIHHFKLDQKIGL